MTAQQHSEMVQRLTELGARHHREQNGNEAAVTVDLLEDLAIFRSSSVFTATEIELAQTDAGRKLVQSARREHRALTRRIIEAQVGQVLGRTVLRSFYDLDVRTGDQLEAYVLG